MSNQGTILLTVIVVLVFLTVMGMSLLGLLFSRITLSMLELDRLKAFYLAEAGIAKSINELMNRAFGSNANPDVDKPPEPARKSDEPGNAGDSSMDKLKKGIVDTPFSFRKSTA